MRAAHLSAVLSLVAVAFGGCVERDNPRVKIASAAGFAETAGAPAPDAAPSDSDWLSRAQQSLAAREYRASETVAGLQAPNRAHDLRTYFDASGIRVHDRTDAGTPELLRLSLARIGRSDALAVLGPGEVTSDASRVEIARPGLLEWYVNSPAGLEQGFTLAERLAGAGPLVLELAVAGGASARQRGDALVFETQAERTLGYGALAAEDASGRALAAHFELPAADRLRIVVDDAAAAYPVVIDPLLTETADTLIASAQADAHLGFSVAGAGDVNGDGYADVIVGAPQYDAGESAEGAAFVFLGSASGIADATAAAAATQLESDQADACLGTSAAGAGDVNGDGYADVVVGAFLYDAGEADEGAAFVFLGSASGIADGTPATAAAQLESNQAGAQLGISVAGAGDVNGDGYADVVAGAWSWASPDANEGAAFVFLGSASGVADGTPATAATQLESDQPGAQLGVRVAGAGDVNGDGYGDLVVGAYLYDAGEADEGAAFVFTGSASGIADGTPASAATQLESDQPGAQLGASVAGAGDVNGDGRSDVIVGVPGYDAGDGPAEGAAFVFHGSVSGVGDGSPASAAAQLESNQAGAQLGFSVAGAGDVDGDGYADVVVGAPFYSSGGASEGAAFVFPGGSAGVADGNPGTSLAQLESDQADARVGIGVSGAGDVNGDGYADVIVGAWLADAGEADEGTALVYHGAARVEDSLPAAQLESDQTNAQLGYSVSSAGDVNGDGYADVIVGAYLFDSGQTDEGGAFVFLGSASGIADGSLGSAAAQLESNQASAWFGRSVSGAGDVNGDGYADVIVGAPQFDASQTNEGSAFIFLGSATGVADGNPATAATQLLAILTNARLGDSVVGPGDVNGDGFADVAVSAPNYGSTNPKGATFVFHGSPSGIGDGNPSNAATQLDGGLPGPVAAAGDLNGDGYADLVTKGAFGTPSQGIYAFLGSASGIPDGSKSSAPTRLIWAWYDPNGSAIYLAKRAGDVNGDGYSDLLVGRHQTSLYSCNCLKQVQIFHGSASGIASQGQEWISEPTPTTRITGDIATDFGRELDWAGDVNGDGSSDLVVNADTGLLYLGSATGIANTATRSATLDGGGPGDIAGAGDVNGDGYADVIIGSPTSDFGETDEGAAFLYLGSAAGRPIAARQLRTGSDTPIQPWGSVDSQTSFRVRMRASHPEGRGRVKLAVEYCPPGVPFGHVSCGTATGASWVDVGPSGVATLTQSVTGLSLNTLYRWRAHVLHAPLGVTQGGISAPPKPAHGPWRRLAAQLQEADVRTLPVRACSDGLDNDGDGVTDHPNDPGCTGPLDASERQAGILCDDGFDNDGDLRADFDPVTYADAPDFTAGSGDPGCASPASLSENPECQDGANNDPSQDPQGLKDFDGGQLVYGSCSGGSCPPGVSDVDQDGVADPDPQCSGKPWKNREKKNNACGLGFELALLVAPLALSRRAGQRR